MPIKDELLRVLRGSRAVLLTKLDALPEYDVRRPLTPTGTNLLGLVKHLAGHTPTPPSPNSTSTARGTSRTTSVSAPFWEERRAQVQAAADAFRS